MHVTRVFLTQLILRTGSDGVSVGVQLGPCFDQSKGCGAHP